MEEIILEICNALLRLEDHTRTYTSFQILKISKTEVKMPETENRM